MSSLTFDALRKLRSESSDGKLPNCVWPGGYPLVYMTRDIAYLCAPCANGENGSEAFLCEEPGEDSWDHQSTITFAFVHWEGEPEICEHCNAEIESAYGVQE